MKSILFALLLAPVMALTLSLPTTSFADVDCKDVEPKNRDECVRAKNKTDNDGYGDNIDCSDVQSKNRDECIEAKRDNDNDVDLDDVDCYKADDPDIRRACRDRKRDD